MERTVILSAGSAGVKVEGKTVEAFHRLLIRVTANAKLDFGPADTVFALKMESTAKSMASLKQFEDDGKSKVKFLGKKEKELLFLTDRESLIRLYSQKIGKIEQAPPTVIFEMLQKKHLLGRRR